MNQTLVLQRVNWRKRLLKASKEDDSTDTGKYFREGSYQTFYENIACIQKRPNLVSKIVL